MLEVRSRATSAKTFHWALAYATVLIGATILLAGCNTDSCAEVDQGLKDLVADGVFDAQDYEKARVILTDAACPSGFSDTMSCNSTLQLLEARVKDLRIRQTVDWQVDCSVVEGSTNAKAPLQVKFFLVNTGSHDGYVRGNTEFKEAMMNMLIDVEYHYGSIGLHYLNPDAVINEVPQDVKTFIVDLQPKDLKVGNYSNSEFNKIFSLLLNDLDRDQVSILVSDCIHSVLGKETETQLNIAQAGTKQVFLNKIKETPLATAVVQLQSRYNGKYWDMRGGRNDFVMLKDIERPYYVWFFGKPEAMARLEASIDFQKLKGFRNAYFLDWHRAPVQPPFTILQNTLKEGRFRRDRQLTTEGRVSGITEAVPAQRGDKHGLLQFAIAIDLSGIKAPDEHLADPRSYLVPEEYEVSEVLSFNRNIVDASDWPDVKDAGYPHILVLSTQVNPALLPELIMKLPRTVPQWVYNATTLDDLRLDKREELHDKTFGFSYIVDGITDAYRTAYQDNEHLFRIQASIKSK